MKYIVFMSIFILLILDELYTGKAYFVNDTDQTGDRYCSQPGNAGNDGEATNTPHTSIQWIIDNKPLTNGVTVFIDTGVYNEHVLITNSDEGSSQDYLTFKGVAQGGTNSFITGTGAPNWSGCFVIDNADYIKIDSLYIQYTEGVSNVRGFMCRSFCSNILVINNVIVSNEVTGIKIEYYTAFSVFSNNKCNYNNLADTDYSSGIILDRAYNNKIIHNECICNGSGIEKGNGIRIENGSLYNVIKSNICSFNNRIGVEVRLESGDLNDKNMYNKIIRNICVSNRIGIRIGGGAYGNPHNFILSNYCNNNITHGIECQGGPVNESNVVIGNSSHHNGENGINFFYESVVNQGNTDFNIIESNICYQNGIHGINIDGNNNILTRNLCYSNGGNGINMQGGQNMTNLFNVCFENSDNGILINNWIGSSLVRNCTLINNDSDGLKVNGSGSCDVRNCIAMSNTGWGFSNYSSIAYSDAYGNNAGNYSHAAGIGCITNNPVFISMTFGETGFLRLSGFSPCINAGDPSDPVPLGGEPRIDMGRYEFIGANITLSKSISEITLNSINEDPIPGSTIKYHIKISNSSSSLTYGPVIYDKIPQPALYKTNSAEAPMAWVIEYSTNSSPDQTYSSQDYVTQEPSSMKVKWIRWKKPVMEITQDFSFYFGIIIK